MLHHARLDPISRPRRFAAAECATLRDLVEISVRATPHAPAIVYRERVWSYADLEGASSAIAGVLAAAGVERGHLVAVALERSPESVAVLYAVTKLGAAFVPLDPDAPEARQRRIVTDARPMCTVASARFADALRTTGTAVVVLDDLLRAAETAAPCQPPDDLGRRDLAYVIYTSGSTGEPKGVMIEHGAVVNTLRSARERFGYAPRDRIYQLAAWSFDPAVLQIFGALASGACVVLNSTAGGVDFAAVADEIVERKVSVFDSVPALLAPLLERKRLADSALRIVGVGGAVARGTLRNLVTERLGIPLWNHYGPTETAILATVYRATGNDADARIPIGTPLDNTYAYVLDAQGEPAGTGVEGELFIGGAGVARGYLGRPLMTAERFVTDPFCGAADGRMYRTGDIVVRRDDGELAFIGRHDDQVKIRGVRVELEEVQHVLGAHPNVAQAAVLVEGDEGNERLIGYVEPRAPERDLSAALLSKARATLAPAAQPARIAIVAAMPLLSSGKIDRAALHAAAAAQVAAPRSPRFDTLYDAIRRIWVDVLGRDDITPQDDFFALGGNSLAAARCAARIERQFGQRIALAVLFAEPTIAGLARVLRTNERLTLAPIVEVAGGTKSPFFFLHGDFTGVGLYVRGFAGALDGDRPIYALPPHGADGGAVPATIEAMAESHLAAIRTVKPHGPYLLGGYCIGGVVALEVARQFEALGERVIHVLAIDAHRVVPRSRTRRLASALRHYHAWARPAAGVDPTTAHVERAQHRAVDGMVRPFIPASVTMLSTQDDWPDAVIERNWKPFVRELTIRRIPGQHTTALTDYLDVTCAAMTDVLRRVDGEN